jgi:CheY-like chemotaxis protein
MSMLVIVDDALPSRYATARILSQGGYDVREVATGMEALRLARQGPDLIILDLKLPDVSGFEVCARLKADPSTRGIPVLMKTAAHVTPEDRKRGLACGAVEYLMDPTLDQLVDTVKRLLREGPRTSPP